MIDVNKLKDYKYVSFDIFDTIIKRNCSNPHVVFQIVQNQYNINAKEKVFDFFKRRIDSENGARKNSNNEEVDFDEIYEYLEKYYDENVCKMLKKIEIDIELNICQKNYEMDNVLEYCETNNKKIVITSDMYLNKAIVEKILKENGIKYYKLFLSSDYKVSKRSGKLFMEILKDLKIEKNELIHIGDNYKSDYLIPKEMGIASINYIMETCNRYNKLIKDNLDSSILNSFIQNNFLKSEEQVYDWGYSCFGPILYGFSQWLLKQLEVEKIDKVYFMARDGYIMKEAFDIINSNENIKSYYLYASRRAIIVPSLWKCKKVAEIYDLMFVGSRVKLKSFIKMIGLEDIDLLSKIQKYNLELNKEYNIDYMKNDDNFCSFMEEIFDKIVDNSKREFLCMKEYFKSVNFKGKVAIVDIGWHGNMQLALSKIVDNTIYGYYVGLVPKCENQRLLNMKGFLFDSYHDEEVFYNVNRNNAIFEFLFLARHGSVKRFNDSVEKVEFYDYEYHDSFEIKLSENIQKGAMDFIKCMFASDCKKYICFNSIVCINNFISSLDKPNKEILNVFGNMKFFDNGVYYIAKPKKLSYYILHPRTFFYEFRDSLWRIGFLNRIVYAPYINYHLIISLNKTIKRKRLKKEN